MLNVQTLFGTLKECYDCAAKPGEYHELGCDVERCPRCGGLLLECGATGCPGSRPGEPWPPPLDDREVWTGEWPGDQECREFGWYTKVGPDGKRWVPCRANDPGARPDLTRLRTDADWDRREHRYVRTNLTAAFGGMRRRGILGSRGHEYSRPLGVAAMTRAAARAVTRGRDVSGFAFYTLQGRWKLHQGQDFPLYCGEVWHPFLGFIGLTCEKVGEDVCDCLAGAGVGYRWDGDPARPIRIRTASIAPFPPAQAGEVS